MRVLVVTGSRKHSPEALIRAAVEGYDLVLHGDAPGVDWCTRQQCRKRGIPQLSIGAFWNQIGSGAGPERNQEMVDHAVMLRDMGHSVRAAAFPAYGSTGTRDCMRRLRAAGIETEVHEL
jgi:hypothetical protein